MRHFALIGRKLGHSFSANFFNSKFQIEGIDADYQLIELEDIDQLKELLVTTPLDGFNVTIPYKESIIPYLDELDDAAREVGAVNCVEIKEGRLIGHNTDIEGVEASLHWLDVTPEHKALVLGTGGASKAVQYILRKYGVVHLVVSRDKGRGDITYNELTPEVLASYTVVINTTPLGMSPDTESYPILNYQHINPSHRILDLVYNPATTAFMKRCEEQGATAMGGMLMLQTQAIASWHIWRKCLGM